MRLYCTVCACQWEVFWTLSESKNSSFTAEPEKTTESKANTDNKKPVTEATVKPDSSVKPSTTAGLTGLKTPEKTLTDNETYVKNLLASATKAGCIYVIPF